MTTPPLTAHASATSPVPERPEMYGMVYLHGNEWRLMPCRPENTATFAERKQRPGSVIVTIPGSSPTPETQPAGTERVESLVETLKQIKSTIPYLATAQTRALCWGKECLPTEPYILKLIDEAIASPPQPPQPAQATEPKRGVK